MKDNSSKKEYMKKWRERNKEKIVLYNKEWKKLNKEHVYNYDKQYKEKNRKKINNNGNISAKNRRLRNPNKTREKYKRAWLKNRYGITLETYNEILKTQNYLCGICNLHESNFKRSLAVDHCHITGKVRGLLCGNCNKGLGLLKDSPKIIKSCIKYLKNENKQVLFKK